jgi:dUTPase
LVRSLDKPPVVFAKAIPTAREPKRATSGSAGYDLYLPTNAEQLLAEQGIETVLDPIKGLCVVVRPGCMVKLNTHVRMYAEPGWYIKIDNRSGLSSKEHLLVGGSVSDGDYEGMIFVLLNNVSKDHRALVPVANGIAQAVPLMCYDPRIDGGEIRCVSDEDIQYLYSRRNLQQQRLPSPAGVIAVRGEGAEGSTDNRRDHHDRHDCDAIATSAL